MKIEKYVSSDKNRKHKMLYAVYTNDEAKALRAVKYIRKMKEEYEVRPGYVSGKDLWWDPKYGKKKVMVVSVK